MPRVTLHPAPDHIVGERRFFEGFPEVAILYRLLVRRLPTIRLPVRQPFGEAVHHVTGIRVKRDRARTLQRFQALDRGGEFHAIVGREALAAEEFLFVCAGAQNRRPSAWTRITAAGPVGEDFDAGHNPYASALLTPRWK